MRYAVLWMAAIAPRIPVDCNNRWFGFRFYAFNRHDTLLSFCLSNTKNFLLTIKFGEIVEKCLLRTITSIAVRPKASLGQNLIKHH